MARKLTRDSEGKRTFMRENALSSSAGLTHWCANCKRRDTKLYKYWWEQDIGGQNKPDKFALPFCSVECYRKYNNEPEEETNGPTGRVHTSHGNSNTRTDI